jgi:hypothetical protein
MLFKREELQKLSVPTMDRVLEELEEGNIEDAKKLCKIMKHEWLYLHDLIIENLGATIAFIVERLGEQAVYEMNREAMEKIWRQAVETMVKTDPRKVVENITNTLRAHSCSGVGQYPAKFTVQEDEEKFTFIADPCGSGGRMWRKGFFDPPRNYGYVTKAYPWSFGKKDFPYYCVHCSLMNELLPIEWIGYPINPMEPPSKAQDPCIMYYYKDPHQIPAKYWERYNLKKSDYMPIKKD